MILDPQNDYRLGGFPRYFMDVGNVSFGGFDYCGTNWDDLRQWQWNVIWTDRWTTRPGFFRNPLDFYPLAPAYAVNFMTTNTVRSQCGFGAIASTVMPWVLVPSNPVECAVITNRTLLNIWRDPYCSVPVMVSSNATGVVLEKSLANGDVAVLLWNWTSNSASMSCPLTELTLRQPYYSVKDAWDGLLTAATNTLAARVNGYGANLYRLSPFVSAEGGGSQSP
jgi:hypothetical protein